MNLTVSPCPKCGETHTDLRFYSLLKKSPDGVTHYAHCPKTSIPILATADGEKLALFQPETDL